VAVEHEMHKDVFVEKTKPGHWSQ